MAKTPEYVRKATANYQAKYDLIQVRFDKGTRERIQEQIGDRRINDYISSLVYADLDRLENADKGIVAEEQKEPRKADKQPVEKEEFDELNEMIKRLQKENEEGKLSLSYRENVENKQAKL